VLGQHPVELDYTDIWYGEHDGVEKQSEHQKEIQTYGVRVSL